MPTILLKKSDTPGSVPGTANLTNLAGGAEVAVNTADKRMFSMTSASAVIELGTNPSSLTCADASLTVARIGSLTVSSLSLTNVTVTSATVTTLTGTSANITTVTGTTAGFSSANITQFQATSATITTLTGTSANVTNASAGSLTVSAGNLTFSGTGQRITGDMSNATLASRLAFQTSTANNNTSVAAIPNGTATQSAFNAFNASDPTNSSTMQLICATADSRLTAGATGTGTNLPMTFYTGGSERMRLDTSGNLGIGTASPNKRFSVISGGSTQFTIETTAGANDIIKFDTYNASAVNGVYTWSQQGTERMRIDSSGNVGIGTASPGNAFVVSRGAGVAAYLQSISGSNNSLFGHASGGELVTGAFCNQPYLFYTNSAERMRIDSSGNVGIGGTASSFSKFEVTGTLPTSGNTTQTIRQNGTLPSGSTTDSYGYVNVLNTAAASFTCSGYSHYFAFQSALGAGSAVTNQFGFHAGSTLTGATNNFGFYSDIASGSNRWNFYAAGTADNYFAGSTGVGISPTAHTSYRLVVDGTGPGNAALFKTGTTAGAPVSSMWHTGTSGDNWFIDFYTETAATLRGSITYNRGAGQVAYNVTSDVRLKENIADAVDAGDKIDAMQVRQFDWKETGNHLDYGFVAQELHNVAPHAVSKPTNDDEMWSVDYSKLVPILVKELQAVRARLAALEAK